MAHKSFPGPLSGWAGRQFGTHIIPAPIPLPDPNTLPNLLYNLRSMDHHAGGVVPLKKSHVSLLLLTCLIGFVATAGCTETLGEPAGLTPTPEATPPAHIIYSPAGPQPSFLATVTAPEKHFRADMSCYWVVTGTVTNTGDAPGRNVVIRFMLVDDESGMVRSTETILIPRFQAGETKMFTADQLPGDCGRQYRADIGVTHDIP